MQVSGMQHQKNCLATAMAKYSSATRNMEQVVMFPSLLREVPIEPQDATSTQYDARDLHENYIMLKSIRMTVETGLIPLDDWKAKASIMDVQPETGEGPNLEALFHSHVRGLLRVLNCLTNQAHALTRRYKDIVGMTN